MVLVLLYRGGMILSIKKNWKSGLFQTGFIDSRKLHIIKVSETEYGVPMAGMKRFVTYIYTYEDGKKGNNAGFAKIEIRGADCRVEIHMRGIFAWRGTGRVFLFRKAEDRMEGVRIGEIRPVNGGGSLAVMVRSEKIGDTPFGIGDMEGIFILSEDDRIFMSRWREGELPEVSKERFHEWQPDLSRGGNAQTEPAGQPELRGRDDGDVRPGVSEGVSGRVQSDRPAVREDLHRQSQPGGTKGIPGPGQSRQPAVREDPHRQSQPAASETAENMPSVAARPMQNMRIVRPQSPVRPFQKNVPVRPSVNTPQYQETAHQIHTEEETAETQRQETSGRRQEAITEARRQGSIDEVPSEMLEQTEDSRSAAQNTAGQAAVQNADNGRVQQRAAGDIGKQAAVQDAAGQAAGDIGKQAAVQDAAGQAAGDIGKQAAVQDAAGQTAEQMTDSRMRQEQDVLLEKTPEHVTPQDDISLAKEAVQATEIPMRNILPGYDWKAIWENLTENHPLFTPFDDRETVCIQIELRELRDLPRRYWYLGNNSFLLHGFFNYRYLVVGKTGGGRWFLGVPGIYQRQERVMAAIFGFPEFVPTAAAEDESETGEPVNRFGCWYRYIEE